MSLIDGLDEKFIGTGFQRGLACVRKAFARHGNEQRIAKRIIIANRGADAESIRARHEQIAQDGLRQMPAGQFGSVATVRSLHNLPTVAPEQTGQRVTHIRAITKAVFLDLAVYGGLEPRHVRHIPQLPDRHTPRESFSFFGKVMARR
jgi:hypothetical protein